MLSLKNGWGECRKKHSGSHDRCIIYYWPSEYEGKPHIGFGKKIIIDADSSNYNSNSKLECPLSVNRPHFKDLIKVVYVCHHHAYMNITLRK